MVHKVLKGLIKSVSRLNSGRPGVQKQNDKSHNTKENPTKDENKWKIKSKINRKTLHRIQKFKLPPKNPIRNGQIITKSAQKSSISLFNQSQQTLIITSCVCRCVDATKPQNASLNVEHHPLTCDSSRHGVIPTLHLTYGQTLPFPSWTNFTPARRGV